MIRPIIILFIIMSLWQAPLEANSEAGLAQARAINSQGYEAYKKKDYKKAAALFEAAIEKDADYAIAHYNLACVIALTKRPCSRAEELADRFDSYTYRDLFNHLAKAVALDPKRQKRMCEDDDLAQLRKLPEYLLIAGVPPEKIIPMVEWCNTTSDFGSCTSGLRLQKDGVFILWGFMGDQRTGSYSIEKSKVKLSFSEPFYGKTTFDGDLSRDGQLIFESPIDPSNFFAPEYVCAG